MTGYEWTYRCLRPFDQSLTQLVAAQLRRLDRPGSTILDVGGRRSNYTIGLRGQVQVSELPRLADTQHALDLGATDKMREQVLAKRSNVTGYVYDDMTNTQLPPRSFDLIVAMEVLEHVEEDEKFVQNVAKVLKPGGTFLMTTPNGDLVPEPFPDHKRHYRRDHLRDLLSRHLTDVDVRYIVNVDRWRSRAGWFQLTVGDAILSAPLLFLSYQRERLGFGGSGPMGKRHLMAIAQAK